MSNGDVTAAKCLSVRIPFFASTSAYSVSFIAPNTFNSTALPDPGTGVTGDAGVYGEAGVYGVNGDVGV